jgi:hypothetical protein
VKKTEDRRQETEDRSLACLPRARSRGTCRRNRKQRYEKEGDLGFLGKIGRIHMVFLQNKANFHQAKMNAKPIKTKDYEKRCVFRVQQKQSQSKPISTGLK